MVFNGVCIVSVVLVWRIVVYLGDIVLTECGENEVHVEHARGI